MSLSPNQNKSRAETILCMARALMSRDPAQIDLVAEVVRFLMDRDDLKDKWVEVRGTVRGEDFRWFLYELTEGSGKSIAQLPKGITAEELITPVGDWSIRELLHTHMRDYRTDTSGDPVIPDKRLERVRAACDDDFRENSIASFRRWLSENAKHPIPDRPDLPMVTPEHLMGFAQDIATLRSQYAADALTMGCVAASADICNSLARVHGRFDGRTFSRFAWYVSSGDELDPVRILNGIVQLAVQEGHVPELVKIAETYGEKAESRKEAAVDAPNVDQHLERLYEAIPYAEAAFLIYSWILRHATDLPADKRKQFKGSERRTNEMLACLSPPFLMQVLDLEGHVWNMRRNHLRQLQAEKGEQYATEFAEREFVKRLFYPKVVLGSLLELEETAHV